MEYLKEVKRRFTNSPKVKTIIYIGNYCLQVYSSFLDIMKEFKSQEIGTHKVIESKP